MPQVEFVSEIQRRNKLEHINEITHRVIDGNGEFGSEFPDCLFSAMQGLGLCAFNIHLDKSNVPQLILLHQAVDRRRGVLDVLFVAVGYFQRSPARRSTILEIERNIRLTPQRSLYDFDPFPKEIVELKVLLRYFQIAVHEFNAIYPPALSD